MEGIDDVNPFSEIGNSIFGIFGGEEFLNKSHVWKRSTLIFIAIGIIIFWIISLFILYAYLSTPSTAASFGTGRTAASCCCRNQQAMRYTQPEYPISQPESDATLDALQGSIGAENMQYSRLYNPGMENVYSGFDDRKQFAYKPEGGPQEVYNDNTFFNIAAENYA